MKAPIPNIPANTPLGVMLLDLVGSKPRWDLPPFTAPGCMISTGFSPIALVHTLPGPTLLGAANLGIPHGFEGWKVHAQFVAFDPTLGHVVATTNAIEHTVGLR